MSEAEYVEIVGIIATVMILDTCTFGLGLPDAGLPDHDHILIGREGGIEREFAVLRDELAAALARAAAGNSSKRTSVIMLYQHGGASQLETYDLKPGMAMGN